MTDDIQAFLQSKSDVKFITPFEILSVIKPSDVQQINDRLALFGPFISKKFDGTFSIIPYINLNTEFIVEEFYRRYKTRLFNITTLNTVDVFNLFLKLSEIKEKDITGYSIDIIIAHLLNPLLTGLALYKLTTEKPREIQSPFIFDMLTRNYPVNLTLKYPYSESLEEKLINYSKDILFVGFGGLNANVYSILKLHGYNGYVVAFDPDKYDLTNLPRILFHPQLNKGVQSNRIIDKNKIDIWNIDGTSSILRPEDCKNIENAIIVITSDPQTNKRFLQQHKNAFVIGHINERFKIMNNCNVDNVSTDLTRETYGTVDLSKFFNGCLKLTENLVDVSNEIGNNEINIII